MSNDNNGYNGWTNYETWVVNLWLSNEQGSQEQIEEQAEQSVTDAIEQDESDVRQAATYALSKYLEEMHDECVPETTGVFADLINHALGMVDWYEIAKHYVDEISVYSAGWNMPGFMPDNVPSLFTDADTAREFIAEALESAAGDSEDSAQITELTSQADAVRAGTGEFGETIGEFHYFITAV